MEKILNECDIVFTIIFCLYQINEREVEKYLQRNNYNVFYVQYCDHSK